MFAVIFEVQPKKERWNDYLDLASTWKEEGDSAVITWNTGWTTKITREGNRYVKEAYRKGQSLTAAPANTSDAEKAK